MPIPNISLYKQKAKPKYEPKLEAGLLTLVITRKKQSIKKSLAYIYLSKIMCLLLAQLCPSLCNYSLPGSSVCGTVQARRLEWAAISYSQGSSQPWDQTCVSSIAGGFFTTEPSGKPK